MMEIMALHKENVAWVSDSETQQISRNVGFVFYAEYKILKITCLSLCAAIEKLCV